MHSRFQQIALLDTESGEGRERRLEPGDGQARQFYAALRGQVRVGMEAGGYSRWFEPMLAEQGHQLWIGDAAQIRAARVRKQKTDARDAQHILQLLVEGRFPRVWVPPAQDQDLWQLLRHRDQTVRWQTSVKDQLQALALALLVGPVERFGRSKQLVSYLGLNPSEASSGGRQRLGAISKQGNWLARLLLIQAAQTASRTDVGLRRHYQRLVFRRGKAVAKVAIARQLAVRLYWMLRQSAAGSHAGQPVVATGPHR